MGLIQGRNRSSRMIVLAETTQINSSATSRLIIMTVRFSLEEAGPAIVRAPGAGFADHVFALCHLLGFPLRTSDP
jgi:hypothetical protein